MERLFFSITRWLMLAGATLAFIFLIGGSIYAFKLYQESKDTKVTGTVYQPKDPKVSFSDFERLHNEKIEQLKQQKEDIKRYVVNVIKDGSSGHGFKLGNMPGGLIKDINKSKKIAEYIVNKLHGKRPNSFGACVACHGEDGKGENGNAPSLIELPIYHGKVSKQGNSVAYAPSLNTKTKHTYSDPLKQYSAEVASKINMYAINADQNGTTVDDIYDLMKRLNRKYQDSFWLFKNNFNDGLDSLLNYGENKKKSQAESFEYIKWDEYIAWFIKDFDNQLRTEQEKYRNSVNALERKRNQKISKATQAKMELYELLTALGTALIVFILFTMILVLFKIEFNTRNVTQEQS